MIQKMFRGKILKNQKILHLVLTYHWYDETVKEIKPKRTEYRAMSERWKKIIWDRKDEYTHVRFARGYTSTMKIFEIKNIDIGNCPIENWDDQYYRIHFV